MVINNTNHRYQILDRNKRFVDFDGIQLLDNRKIVEISTGNNKVRCTLNHRVLTSDNMFIPVKQLSIGQKLSNGERIVYKRILDGLNTVYDIINAGSTNSYYTNNFVSHNCSFVGSSNTLIESSILNTLPIDKPIDKKDQLYYFEYPKKDHNYVITVDVSRGRGLDYSTFTVFDITNAPYNVVCSFKDNTISPNVEFPVLLNKIGRLYNLALIVVENNDLGESVGSALWFDWEYDNLVWTHNEQISTDGVIGVKTTRKVKSVGTNTLKTLIENHQLILHDFRYIQELTVFVRQKKGLYGAQDTKINDDLTANLWLFGWLTQQTYFQELTNSNINQTIGQKFFEEVDEYIPTGFFSDGINDDIQANYLSQDQIDLLNDKI